MLLEYKGLRPQIAENVYIAPNATIIGDVVLSKGTSVWFGAVIRGDSGSIRLGAGSNVQDNVVIHVNNRHDTIIEENVTIGHAAVLEGCHIGRNCLIGMNATILDGVIIGEGCVIAAGSVIREGSEIPAGMLVAGVPAKVKGAISPAMIGRIEHAAEAYQKYAQIYQTDTAVIYT